MNPKRRPTQKLRRRGGSQGLKLRKGDDPLSRDHGVGGGRNPQILTTIQTTRLSRP